MDNSILITVRKALGIPSEYDGFDTQVVLAINTAIMTLSQLGIGPIGGLVVTGIDQTWADLYAGVSNIEAVKSYILLKTRLEFDPPQTAHLVNAITTQIDELVWRLMVEVDPPVPVEEPEEV